MAHPQAPPREAPDTPTCPPHATAGAVQDSGACEQAPKHRDAAHAPPRPVGDVLDGRNRARRHGDPPHPRRISRRTSQGISLRPATLATPLGLLHRRRRWSTPGTPSTSSFSFPTPTWRCAPTQRSGLSCTGVSRDTRRDTRSEIPAEMPRTTRPPPRTVRGRSMINIHDGGPDALVDANKFINKHTIVECGGYGEMRPRSTEIDV